jgi:bifunctional DNase/RNase
VITTFNGALNHIQVTDVSDNTFYARIIIDKEGQELEFDSRPSDAIALALRFNCPILLNPEVLASSGIEMDDLQEKSEKGKGQLESYRGALKKAITDERYEDAAKLRDQILHLQKHQ